MLLVLLSLVFVLSACENGLPPETGNPKPNETPTEPNDTDKTETDVLVAYFSCTNTTKAVAEKIAASSGAKLWRIQPEIPYTDADLNYTDNNCRANKEQNNPYARPAISGKVEDMSQYKTVFIGYPIWWGTLPKIVLTFLDAYDLSGKTIVPFCTSGGSGITTSVSVIRHEEPNATVLEGKRFSGNVSSDSVKEWMDSLNNKTESAKNVMRISVTIGQTRLFAMLEENSATTALVEKLQKAPVTIEMKDYGGFEKVGAFGFGLPTSDEQITAQPCDILLYQGNQFVIFYGSNSWSYTRLGKITGATASELKDFLNGERVSVTLSLFGVSEFDLQSGTNGNAPKVMLNSGYEMPILGIGTYSLQGETCVNSVLSALQSGVRLIDTASMYGNEREVGQAIRQSGVPREEIYVITKIYPGEQFANPEKAIQDALDKLDVGYIDMMLLHHPGVNDVKAYKAIEKFVEQGKIRSIGLSNWYVEEIDGFLAQVDVKPALVQNEIHPYYQEKTVVPHMHELGIVVQAWYPFGGRGHTGAMLSDKTIVAIANAHGVSAAQVILRWHLQRGVVAIPGSSNPAHIKENVSVFDFELSENEMAAISALDRDEKHDWY